MVYIQSKNGTPLMPTENHARVRCLLKAAKARVVKLVPFTIRLLGTSRCYRQDVTAGVDAGSKHVGISASTEKQELFAAELRPRNDVVKPMSDRREFRRGRRSRTTRYRKPRFDNRSKHKGWLAPSVEVKIQNHIQGVRFLMDVLPVTRLIVEMGIMRKTLVSRLRTLFPNIKIKETFGYVTKYWREKLGLEKSHTTDAFVIAGNFDAKRIGRQMLVIPKREHNRKIHKAKIGKGGVRKNNQTPKRVFGFQLFDRVMCNGQEGFVFGRRASGSFDIRKLDGTVISSGVSCKKLKHLEYRKPLLVAYV